MRPRLLLMVVLLVSVAGCGTFLDPMARAREACPTLTETQFTFAFSGVTLNRENGVSRSEQLQSSLSGCPTVSFDTTRQCRECVMAIVDAVFGP